MKMRVMKTPPSDAQEVGEIFLTSKHLVPYQETLVGAASLRLFTNSSHRSLIVVLNCQTKVKTVAQGLITIMG